MRQVYRASRRDSSRPGVLIVSRNPSAERSLRALQRRPLFHPYHSGHVRPAMASTFARPATLTDRTTTSGECPGVPEMECPLLMNKHQTANSISYASVLLSHRILPPQCSGTAMLCAVRDWRRVVGRNFGIPISWPKPHTGALSRFRRTIGLPYLLPRACLGIPGFRHTAKPAPLLAIPSMLSRTPSSRHLPTPGGGANAAEVAGYPGISRLSQISYVLRLVGVVHSAGAQSGKSGDWIPSRAKPQRRYGFRSSVQNMDAIPG